MSFGRFLALSFSLSLRFVVRVAFIVLIGYYLDTLLGTFPWMMIFAIIPGTYFGWLSIAKIQFSEEIKK